MTACIVGWSHTPFGRHEDEDVESLIVQVARDAVADAGLEPADIDEIVLGHFNGGFCAAGLHQLAGAAGRRRLALQAGDPGRERLRHRLGRDPPGAELDRRRAARASRWWSASRR